jgi:hypothetical protein
MSRPLALVCAFVAGTLLVISSANVGRSADAKKKVKPAAIEPAAAVPRPFSPTWVSPAEKKIIEALNSPTQFAFDDVPLDDVVKFLKDSHHIEIQIDMHALSDTGIEPSTPIKRDVKGISLRSALKILLSQLGLTAVIHNEVLYITSEDTARSSEFMVTKIYRVDDLVTCRDPKTGDLWEDYDQLKDAITRSITPVTWEANGGSGSISSGTFGPAKVLIVAALYDEHEQIADFLRELRTIGIESSGRSGSTYGPPEPPTRARPKPSTAGGKCGNAPTNGGGMGKGGMM